MATLKVDHQKKKKKKNEVYRFVLLSTSYPVSPSCPIKINTGTPVPQTIRILLIIIMYSPVVMM